jgi:hypothetical protein
MRRVGGVEMRKIYIAGPLGPKSIRKDCSTLAIEYLLNVRDFLVAANECIKKGWAPFCPALDFMYFVALPPGATIDEQTVKDVSMAWLEASDAILLINKWTLSEGACAEADRAIDLGLEVYDDISQVPEEKK